MKARDDDKPNAIDQALLELPRSDVAPAVSARILASALEELEASKQSIRARLAWTYDWVLEPALVLGLGALYIGRAFQVVAIIKGL